MFSVSYDRFLKDSGVLETLETAREIAEVYMQDGDRRSVYESKIEAYNAARAIARAISAVCDKIAKKQKVYDNDKNMMLLTKEIAEYKAVLFHNGYGPIRCRRSR